LQGRTRSSPGGKVFAAGAAPNESRVIVPAEPRPQIPNALFTALALLAAARLGRCLRRLVSAVVPIVVRHGLRDLFRG